MSAPEPGSVLAGKYRVERVLGTGGMGTVVSAYHLQLDQHVAIKYLLPEALKNPEVVARFAREARAAAKIRSEHVARVVDVGEFADGSPYMVMEYLEGRDLAKHLEVNGPLPVAEAVRYILEACEALAQAHAAKIVHRDLKPSNLFLADQPDKRAIVKVLDFGISKVGDASSAGLTHTSALMGTAFYMSPEQLMTPKAVDARSDIWALGVILYELLAGKTPFAGETVPEIIAAIIQNTPEPLRSHRPDLPTALEEVVAKCMKPVESRFENVARLARALGPFASASDRLSIEVASRVLGDSYRPEAPPTAASAAPAEPAKVVVTPAQPVALAASMVGKPTLASPGAAPTPSAPSSPGAVTNQAMSTSAIHIPTSSGRGAIAGILAVVLLVGGVAAAVLIWKKDDAKPPASGGGLVGAPATTSPQASTAPVRDAPKLTPIAEPAPEPSATAAAAPPRPTLPVRPGASAGSAPKPPAPAASSAAPAVASAPPPPAPPAASATTTGKANPLNMGIK